MKMKASVVITTCPDKSMANALAKGLVEKKLAACVQIEKIESIYSWEDAVCHDEEYRLMIKTKAHAFNDISAYITENHEYDIPELIMLPIEAGSEKYLNWISDEVI
jgi:periplasmic divalent cation tolerance protein